jgi:prepilin-type N-terminal cleavage/methylation domain-containing protein/prepilin-type processing-associated H-X9-DG protein
MDRRTRAFTLVELLVVISILALLISILLPALRGARAQARQVACGSNLRQVALSLGMYADDARDWYPRWSGWHVWGYYGTEQDGTGGDDEGPSWAELLRDARVLPEVKVYRCPTFPPQVQVTYFHAARSAWVRYEQRATRRGTIRYPAEYVLGGDCTNPFFYAPPFGDATIHGQSDSDLDNASVPALFWERKMHRDRVNNVQFADGHVVAMPSFDAGQMTHDTTTRHVDWDAVEAPD